MKRLLQWLNFILTVGCAAPLLHAGQITPSRRVAQKEMLSAWGGPAFGGRFAQHDNFENSEKNKGIVIQRRFQAPKNLVLADLGNTPFIRFI